MKPSVRAGRLCGAPGTAPSAVRRRGPASVAVVTGEDGGRGRSGPPRGAGRRGAGGAGPRRGFSHVRAHGGSAGQAEAAELRGGGAAAAQHAASLQVLPARGCSPRWRGRGRGAAGGNPSGPAEPSEGRQGPHGGMPGSRANQAVAKLPV